jgi:vitamin B12 transporter
VLATGMRALACSAFVVAAAASAFAQTVTPTPAPQPSEIVHVTTADRQDEPITWTTRPTYVIDRRQIEAEGARTVADALRLVPGVEIFSYGAFGAQANYGVLGATSEQTLVLLNGFPVAAASSGSIDLGEFSTVGVERIEVVEGGGSTLYGSSAVGGIINIITGHETATPYVALSDGTYGERDGRLEMRFRGLGLALERHLAINAYDYPSLDGFAAGTRTNAQAAASAGRLDFYSNPGARYTIDAALGADGITIGVPGRLDFLTPHAVQATVQQDAHVTLTRHGEHSALSLSLAGAHQALAYDDPDNGGETDTYDGRGQISVREVVGNERGSLVAGIDLSRESALLSLGPSSTPPSASAALAQSAAYAQYRDALSRAVALTVGIRGEHDAPQGSVVVPSFGTSVQLGAARLSADYAGTFRVPTIDELYFPGFANPALVPERSKNADAALTLPLGGASASFEWFDRQAVNLIVLDQNFVPQNVARASLSGFVLSGHTAPLRGIVASLGITDLYRALNETPGRPVTRLDFEPVLTTVLGLEKLLGPGGGVGFGIDAQVHGPHFEQGGTTFRDGATTVDAYVRMRLARYAIATLRARNLGSERYAPIFGYPAPGRTLELELSTQ